MAVEVRKIPAIALRAYRQELHRHMATLDAMGDETIEAMNVGDGWTVDFEAGEVRREAPDPAPPGMAVTDG